MMSGEVWDNVCGIWSGRPGVYTYIHHSGPVYVYVCANKYYNDVPMIYTLCHLAIHVHVLM